MVLVSSHSVTTGRLPRVPPILRYLGTDQAALYMWCQSDGVSQFIELRRGSSFPGLYTRVEVCTNVYKCNGLGKC